MKIPNQGPKQQLRPVVLTTWKAEIQRNATTTTTKKFLTLHLNQWLATEVHTSHPSYSGKHK
jgi:hypothetical protein